MIYPVKNLEMGTHTFYAGKLIKLTWDYPEMFSFPHQRQTFGWIQDYMGTAFGAMSPAIQECAQRFDANDMMTYLCWQVKKITFGVFNVNINKSYSAVIWKGTCVEDLVVIYKEEVDCSNNKDYSEAEAILSESIIVEDGCEYWFGVQATNLDNRLCMPFVCDMGPNQPEKGLWLRVGCFDNDSTIMDNWENPTSASHYNLCLYVDVESPETGEIMPVGQNELGILKGYNVSANGELVKEINDPYTRHYSDLLTNNAGIEYCVTAII